MPRSASRVALAALGVAAPLALAACTDAWQERASVNANGEVEVAQILRGRLAEASHLVARAHLAADREEKLRALGYLE